MRAKWVVVMTMLGGALAGCGQAPAPEPMPVVEADAPPMQAPAIPEDDAGLQAAADQAMREQHLFAPAGANAVEYFLALRERPAHAAAAGTALVQLQPYLMLGIERSLQDGGASEAGRLVDLLARADPAAPALPRLRQAVSTLLADQARQEAALTAQAAAARPEPRPAAPAPAAPSVQAPSTPVPAVVAAPATPAPARVETPPAAATAVPTVPAPGARRQPRLLADVSPRYPLPALRGRIEGQVELSFRVMPDGAVRDVRVVSADPAGLFDASALAVAARWQFEATGEQHTMQRVLRYRLPAGS